MAAAIPPTKEIRRIFRIKSSKIHPSKISEAYNLRNGPRIPHMDCLLETNRGAPRYICAEFHLSPSPAWQCFILTINSASTKRPTSYQRRNNNLGHLR